MEAKAWQAFSATLLLERSKFGLNELLGANPSRGMAAPNDQQPEQDCDAEEHEAKEPDGAWDLARRKGPGHYEIADQILRIKVTV